jgi:hypothetical protein
MMSRQIGTATDPIADSSPGQRHRCYGCARAPARLRPAHRSACVLSGMLRDGTEGIRAVKRHGGRVLAQDPATARAAGMPSSALATGCVDFVLPPRRIAAALIAWRYVASSVRLYSFADDRAQA